MPFLSFLITFLLSTLLGELTRPSPESPEAQGPPDQSTFKFPTISQGRAVPVTFGTVRQEGPNVLWWGNYRTQAVVNSQRIRTGLFKKKTIHTTVGYRFFFSIAVGLGHKGQTWLRQFLVEEKTAWSGFLAPNTSVPINLPDLFGGIDKDGGYIGNLVYLVGIASPVVTGIDVTGHQNLSMVVWDGEVGTNPFIKRWSFITQRFPFVLPGVNHFGGCNPAELVYDVLTDQIYGAGMPPADIDSANFIAVGTVLATESMGLNIEWDQRRRISDFLNDVWKVIDGTGFVSHLTGLYTIKLLRDDFDPNTIPFFDSDSILELENFSRGSWDQTVNEVKVVYTDPYRGYKENTAQAHDDANFRTQGRIVSRQIRYPQIVNAGVASNIAWRELRAGSFPMAKGTFTLNRTAYRLQPGDAFRVKWDPLNIVSMIFRVTKMKLGELKNGRIVVEAVQDVFSLSDSVYGDPEDSTWVLPLSGASTYTIEDTREIPFQYFDDDPERDPLNVPDENRIMVLGARPSGGTITHDTHTRVVPETVFNENRVLFDGFPPTGTLQNAYPLTDAVDESDTLVIEGTLDFESVQSAVDLPEVLTESTNLAWLGEELIAFRDIVDNLDGSFNLNGVVRGVWDTVIPLNHPVGERIWVIFYGRSLVTPAFGDADTVELRNIPSTPIDTLDPILATILSHPITQRSQRPYPPGNVRMNGQTTPVFPPTLPAHYLSGDLLIEWNHRDRTLQDGVVRQDDATDFGPEAGHTYTLRVYNSVDTLLTTFAGITGTSQVYPWAQIIIDNGGVGEDILRVELESVRDGLVSHQFQERKGQWAGYGFGYGTNYGGP